MFQFRHFERRVSISHGCSGELVVRISRNNNAKSNLNTLIGFTVLFTWFIAWIIPPFFRRPFTSGALYGLPFLAFVVVWYVFGARITLWRSFGIEELIVQHGVLQWTRTALFWVRRVEIPTQAITSVAAVTPWHALSNRVEFTALGKTRRVGDMLLSDEATELAGRLRQAVGLKDELQQSSQIS